LEKPLDTQAKELRKRAEVAYLNNWIDEAETDLLEAEKKNYQDFIVHQILGNIYYHHKNNRPKAIEYYQKAAKYASPVSKKHASNALICAGIVYYQLGRLTDSYKSTKMAMELSPPKLEVTINHERVRKLLKEGKKIQAIKAYREETGIGLKEAKDAVEAIENGHVVNVSYKSTQDSGQDSNILYHHARYAAKMGYTDEFKDCLRRSILKDSAYLITADRDDIFSDVKETITKLAEELRDEKRKEVNTLIQAINTAKKEAESVGINDFTTLDNQLAEIKRLCSLNSYFDFLKAEQMAWKAYKESILEWIEMKNSSIGVENTSLSKMKTEENEVKNKSYAGWGIVIAILTGTLAGIIRSANPIFIMIISGVFSAIIIKRIKLNEVRNQIEKTENNISELKNDITKLSSLKK
jgi:tetratricopeptide (TPR) repeat protein